MSTWVMPGPSGNYHIMNPDMDLGDQLVLAADHIAGHERMVLGGRNLDVDAGAPEDIWPGGGPYPFKPTAGPLEIVSTLAADAPAGTGALIVRLRLLDGAWNQQVVDVTMNGLTPVAVPGNWLRINSGIVLTAGSGEANAGDIIVRDAGAGVTRAIMQAGTGNISQTVFSVPVGHTLYILAGIFAIANPTAQGTTALCYLWRRKDGASRRGAQFPISFLTSPWHIPLQLPASFTERTDMAFRAEAAQANTAIYAIFEGLLVRNDQLRV